MAQEVSDASLSHFHLYLTRVQHIYLLLMLAKDEQEDLTTEERASVHAMVTAIKQV